MYSFRFLGLLFNIDTVSFQTFYAIFVFYCLVVPY